MTTAATKYVLTSTTWATQNKAHPHTPPSDFIEGSNTAELDKVASYARASQAMMIVQPRRNRRTVKVESPKFARMVTDTITGATLRGVKRFIIDSPYSMNHLNHGTITPIIDALTTIDSHLHNAGIDNVLVYLACTTGASRSFRAIDFTCQAVNGMGLQAMYYMPIYTIDLDDEADALVNPARVAQSTDMVRISVAGGSRSLDVDHAERFSPWCSDYAREVLWETGQPAVLSYVQTGRRTSRHGLERFQHWCGTLSDMEVTV